MFDQQSRIKATLILRDWLFQYLKDPSTLITFYHRNINFRKWFEQSPREERETREVRLWKLCRHSDSSRAVSVSHKTSRSQKVPVDSGELCDHEMAERSQGWFSVFCVKVVHQLIMKWGGEFTTFSDSLFIMTFIFFVLVLFTGSWELVILTIDSWLADEWALLRKALSTFTLNST